MRVVIEPGAELYRLAARRVAREIRGKPGCVLGLATGRTMLPLYDELVRFHAAEGLSFARVTAFGLDEYVGVDPDEPGSFRHFLRTQLQEPTDLPARSLHLPDALGARTGGSGPGLRGCDPRGRRDRPPAAGPRRERAPRIRELAPRSGAGRA